SVLRPWTKPWTAPRTGMKNGASKDQRLTDRTVRQLKPKGRPYLAADGRGLYLKIQPGGARSWFLRYQIEHKVHDFRLGSYPEISLAEARQRAFEARKQKAEGADPLVLRRRRALAKQIEVVRTITFRDAAEKYIANHQTSWRNPKHRGQWG